MEEDGIRKKESEYTVNNDFKLDVLNIPPEVKHWHGAAKDSWFQHIAVEVPAEGASNEWLEFLPEEEYNKLK